MYLEIDEGFVTHRKTLRFCALMQSNNAFAFILRLWSWACRSAPDGDLTGMEAADIEFAVQYTHADGKCFAALVKAGFIDADESGNPVTIHNWAIRTGAAIRKMADEAKRKKTWRDAHDGTKCLGKDKCQICAGLSADSPRTVQGPATGRLTQTRQDQSRPDQTSFEGGSPAPAPAIHVPRQQAASTTHVLDVWCRTRFKVLGGFELTARQGVSPKEVRDVAEFVSETPGATGFLERSMLEFWESVKSGAHDAAEKAAKHNAFAFACWFKLLGTDIERFSGVAPVIQRNGSARAGPRDQPSTRNAFAAILAREETP